jgi:hypothetical protein
MASFYFIEYKNQFNNTFNRLKILNFFDTLFKYCEFRVTSSDMHCAHRKEYFIRNLQIKCEEFFQKILPII